jgi:ketosteroid isomerase-like protein
MKGPDEVTKGVGAMLRNSKDFKLSFAPTTITVSDAGDMAAERGTYQASWTGSKGKKIEDHGNYVTVWKKVGGQWKVLSDINASDVPGAM